MTTMIAACPLHEAKMIARQQLATEARVVYQPSTTATAQMIALSLVVDGDAERSVSNLWTDICEYSELVELYETIGNYTESDEDRATYDFCRAYLYALLALHEQQTTLLVN